MTNSETTERVNAASDNSKLAELRARRVALEQAREARDAERELKRATAREEQAIADEEAIAAAEREHGEMNVMIRVVNTAAGTVIVKRPNHLLFRKWADNGKSGSEDLEKLIRPNVIYPAIDAFDRMIGDQPGIMTDIGNAVAWLAGARAKENAAK